MARGSKGEQLKSKILECADELFIKNGYTATVINNILNAAELPKGSFYFFLAAKNH